MLDLHEVWGADWDDPHLVRPWPWWRDRIFGLLSVTPVVGTGGTFPATRLGRALVPSEGE